MSNKIKVTSEQMEHFSLMAGIYGAFLFWLSECKPPSIQDHIKEEYEDLSDEEVNQKVKALDNSAKQDFIKTCAKTFMASRSAMETMQRLDDLKKDAQLWDMVEAFWHGLRLGTLDVIGSKEELLRILAELNSAKATES